MYARYLPLFLDLIERIQINSHSNPADGLGNYYKVINYTADEVCWSAMPRKRDYGQAMINDQRPHSKVIRLRLDVGR